MSAGQQLQNTASTSVFQALGSYADRIKDANGSPQKNLTPIPSSSSAPIQDSPGPKSPAVPSTSNPNPVMTKSRNPKSAPAAAEAKPAEDDGPWQTVQTSRARPVKEEKRGSNSKDWRDRSHREGQKEKRGDDGERRGNGQSKSGKKGGSGSAASSSANTAPKSASTRTTAPSTATTKPAWGALATPSQAQQSVSTEIPATTTPEVKEANQSQTVPSSPSLNGTTLTATSTSVTASVGSPNLSADTSVTSTAPPSLLSKDLEALEDEGNWRARPKAKAEAKVEEAQQAAPAKAAPPPAVNAWEVRKKQMTPAVAKVEPKPASTTTTVPPTAHKPLPNGHSASSNTKGSSTKKKGFAQMTVPPLPSHNAELWPDVIQAAEVVKSGEKREKSKERKISEDALAAEEAAIAGKKAKWTPIPASELQAAVDEATEHTRRQSRLEASAKKRSTTGKGAEAEPAAGKAGKAKKPITNGVDVKKGTNRPGRAGSAEEIRLPPSSVTQREPSQPGFKPVFGSVQDEEDGNSAPSLVNGHAAAPAESSDVALSRQVSRQSQAKDASPVKSLAPLSPKGDTPEHVDGTSSSGATSVPLSGSTTAPLPQHSFNPASNPNLPRPRGRDGRGSFNGRGRGGFRSNSAFPYKGHAGFTSPTMGVNGLPAEGMAYANGNTHPRGYGSGFQTFYPATQYPQAGIYDPAQAQYGNMGMYRGSLPPPPMPQTVVPNIDALRFYVLGQVEYYFSMQNLAMDFFLRQQMDSDGWIDVAMIASFKRIKSLTPEVSVVRECMTLSSMLELREDRVRLAGDESQRWVLPGARASAFDEGQEPKSPSNKTEDSKDISSHGIPAAVDVSAFGDESAQQAQRVQQTPPAHRALLSDVENALMKSTVVPASVPSSSTSVANDDEKDAETVTNTPATSMSGDGSKDAEEVELR